MRTDKEIWEQTLKSPDILPAFSVKVGGPNAKPLPQKDLFKVKGEKKIEERIKKLESQVETIISELKKLGRLSDRSMRNQKRSQYRDEQ